jgi:hypothetical protein
MLFGICRCIDVDGITLAVDGIWLSEILGAGEIAGVKLLGEAGRGATGATLVTFF